jgi:hypothetical protein
VERFEAYGFEYSPLLTEKIRVLTCNAKKYLHRTGMIFRNPEVDYTAAFQEPGTFARVCFYHAVQDGRNGAAAHNSHWRVSLAGDMPTRKKLRNFDDLDAAKRCPHAASVG